MPGLDPQVAMHRLNINPDAKQVKQHQQRSFPEIMEAIRIRSQKTYRLRFRHGGTTP